LFKPKRSPSPSPAAVNPATMNIDTKGNPHEAST
jgi:hypothetical protein